MTAILPPGASPVPNHVALLQDLGLVVQVEAGVALVHLPCVRVRTPLSAAQSFAVARPHVWVAKSGKTADYMGNPPMRNLPNVTKAESRKC